MNKDNRTLIILTPGFPKDETDTACLPFLQNFVKELVMQFPMLDVVVLTFDYPFTKSEYHWNKVKVFPFNVWKKNKISRLVTWLSILRKLKKISHGKELAGILSFWCGECAFLGNRFAKKNNLRHYCWIQGQDAKKDNKYVSRMNLKAEELIAVSDFIQTEFGKNHKVIPAWVIPVGINPREFELGQPLRDIDILGVGSLIPLKQYHLFVEVIQQLKKYIPGIRAVLCGKGQQEGELRKLIKARDLDGNITLTGELSHPEILQIMKRSKVFLHTSRYEGICVACQEALYAGCQVISFVRLMNYDIAHWHISEQKDQMIEYAGSVLSNPESVYTPVIGFTTEDSVRKIMHLFN